MVVAVQQPSAECTAIFTVCVLSNIAHLPVQCAVTIHKTCTDHWWNGYQNSHLIQDQRSMCWQHTKHFEINSILCYI